MKYYTHIHTHYNLTYTVIELSLSNLIHSYKILFLEGLVIDSGNGERHKYIKCRIKDLHLYLCQAIVKISTNPRIWTSSQLLVSLKKKEIGIVNYISVDKSCLFLYLLLPHIFTGISSGLFYRRYIPDNNVMACLFPRALFRSTFLRCTSVGNVWLGIIRYGLSTSLDPNYRGRVSCRDGKISYACPHTGFALVKISPLLRDKCQAY